MNGGKKESIAKLLQRDVLVLDGAMGTQLHERGLSFQECFDAANLDRREMVLEIHRSYLEAGAQGIHTNTFGANLFRLSQHRREADLQDIIAAGLSLAHEAAEPHHYVVGAVGPLGVELEPIGRIDKSQARDAFAQVAEYMHDSVDAFSLETFGRIDEVLEAIAGIRQASDKNIVAHMTVDGRGLTPYGTPAEDCALRIQKAGADVIGLNCSTGPRAILETLFKVADKVDRPLSARPNAGMPREVDGRVLYENNPDYFARFARRFLQAGGRLLGGCCGTTPEHIQAMVRAARAIGIQVRSSAKESSHLAGSSPHAIAAPTTERPLKPLPLDERSRLGRALMEKSCPTSIELLPPRTPVMDAMLSAAAKIKDAGATVINIPDGPRASARISNAASAVILEQKLGIETLIHFCCRDRNLLGMQSDILGAAAMGLRNILVVTGDPPYVGNYPNLTAVFDVDSIGLCNIVDNLNHGLDLGGNPIDHATHFCIGAALNPTSLDPDRELSRFDWKTRAGIDFAITQPIFDVPSFLEFLQRISQPRPNILAGIWPLRSLRNAEFLAAEVPGVSVPDDIIERMRAADRKGKAKEAGVEIAIEAVAMLAEHVDGFQIAAPFNNPAPALQVLDAVHIQAKA